MLWLITNCVPTDAMSSKFAMTTNWTRANLFYFHRHFLVHHLQEEHKDLMWRRSMGVQPMLCSGGSHPTLPKHSQSPSQPERQAHRKQVFQAGEGYEAQAFQNEGIWFQNEGVLNKGVQTSEWESCLVGECAPPKPLARTLHHAEQKIRRHLLDRNLDDLPRKQRKGRVSGTGVEFARMTDKSSYS
jgi:hypothetical protein